METKEEPKRTGHRNSSALPKGFRFSWSSLWEPYPYRRISQPENIPFCDIFQGSRTRGLTLNDIQNSLQLILFRMHKYKQMGMPVAVAFPASILLHCEEAVFLGSSVPGFLGPCPGSGSSRISDEASADCTRNNNLANWAILA